MQNVPEFARLCGAAGTRRAGARERADARPDLRRASDD